jgi:peptidoglycan hydrolase-like protein with peptidoglycan-binding domain
MNIKKIALYTGGIATLTLGMFMLTLSYHPSNADASVVSTLSGRNLTIGSEGQDVSDLQGLLGEQGYLTMPLGVPFGYFGPITQAALARYQAANGISPSAGYYGPITRAKMVQQFTDKGWMALLARVNN